VRILLNIVAVWLTSVLPGSALASPQTSSEHSLDIAKQPLTLAMRKFSMQTRQSIGSLTPCANYVVVGPLRGTYTVEAGLQALLAGTSFSFKRVNERTLALIQNPRTLKCYLNIARQPLHSAVEVFSRQTGVRVAYLPRNEREDNVLVGPLEGLYIVHAALTQLLQRTAFMYRWVDDQTIDLVPLPHPTTRVQPDVPAPRSREMERVTVTGSRMYEFAGGVGGGTAPVMVFDRERIEELGLSTIGDLLRYVPQQPYVFADVADLDGSQHAAIRGLGDQATLVLINGRRAPGPATSVFVNSFDVNSIPLAAVERVEVLFDSSTAVYGADAIGGVVNIVMRKAIPPLAAVRYGAAAGGAYERRASLSVGHVNERFEGSFVLDYFARAALLGEERDRWRNWDYRRFGARDLRVLQSNPGNVTSLTAANLPGLSFPFAAVPQESSGVGLTPADFAATAGQQNLTDLLRYWSITPTTERPSVVASGELHITPQLTGFGEFLYAGRHTLNQLHPPRLSTIVPASNAFNPFGVPVAVNYLFTGIGPQPFETDARSLRVVGGIKGRWSDWDWEVTLLRSDEDGRTRFGNNLDPSRVAAALASSDPAQALNVFQDGPGGSPALLASLTAEPLVFDFGWTINQGSVILRGPALVLPSGAIDAVLGGEWRDENLRIQSFGSLARDRHVSSVFGEFRLPLINAAGARPALNELSLAVAARLDHYDDLGAALNPQYGIVWRPHADWALRVSYSTSFDPPSLYELHEQQVEQRGPVFDPRRNEIANVAVLTGGNPGLHATEAESFSAGVNFTPTSLSPLRVTARIWRTSIDDRVVRVGPDAYLGSEATFPERVLRAPPTGSDIAAGLPGMLRFVNITNSNFGRVRTRGVDLEGSYSIGHFTPRVSATWVNEFADYLSGTAPKDRAGVADPRGTIPRWRAVATIGWQPSALKLSATARFVSSYDDTAGYALTGRKVPSQTLVDIQGSLDFDDAAGSLLEGCKLTAGVMNLFDKEPPFSEVNQVYGHDWSQGDLRQRFGYVRLSKQF
jgi:iron complex outermembrane recepter protein